MSRQLDQTREDRQLRRDRAVIEALEFDLVESFGRAGALLTGFSVKLTGGDVLLIFKGELAGRPQVCFVGAATLIDALLKAVREARSDRLSWRADKYVSK